MSLFRSIKKHIRLPIFGVVFAAFLAIFAVSTSPVMSQPVYADTTDAADTTDQTCKDQVGAIGWLICPTTGVLGKAIDAIYNIIEELLTVQPLVNDSTSPVFQVWQIMRDLTNIVFVIVLLIIIYSQITGLGIANYGIKKALPKLIIAAVLVNLSFLICALAVDGSNIIGANLRGLFETIETEAINSGGLGSAAKVTWTELAGALIGGGTIAGISIGLAGGLGAFLWPAIAALIGGILSVLVGLIAIGLRQALVSILVMIAPLAFVAYLLPNTEQYFKKWKNILFSMLIFYPMFSLLFGASQLAGWAIIASASNSEKIGPFFVILGMAVQVFPLFLSVSLFKMSNTVLGGITSKLDGLLNKPRSGVKAFADRQKELSKHNYINNSTTPSAGLRRYLDKRQRRLELDTENAKQIRSSRAEIYARHKIAGNVGYHPGEKDQNLKANTSTRLAKEATNAALELSYVTQDTKHVLDHYDSYHNQTKHDKKLAAASGSNYLEFYRASLAAENDSYADQDWVMNQYNKFRNIDAKDGRSQALRDYEYKHYITGSAGAFEDQGGLTVLGEVISKSAANEAVRKKYTDYAFAKYVYNKRDARDMIVGYANDDDGFAKDPKTGERLIFKDDNGKERSELFPGELLYYHPEKLAPAAYNLYEEVTDSDGKKQKLYYYEARDQKGDFVARVYKNDTPAMKTLLSTWDMPIADPIDSLYGVLAGIYEGDYAKYGLDHIGLAQYSTTIGRAMNDSGFKKKATYAGPMFANSVSNRYIQNPIHLNLARLDNLIKVAKPSDFNTQDQAELNQLRLLMDYKNWDLMLFDYDALKSYRNVNGEHLKGTEFLTDDNGNLIPDGHGGWQYRDIAPDEATHDQLKNTVMRKFINAALPKFASLMSRTTPNIIDNQKPSAQENWNRLFDGIISMSEEGEKHNLIPDEPILDSMSNEEKGKVKAENAKKRAARAKLRQELHEKYPAIIDPLQSLSSDTIQKSNSLRNYSRSRSKARSNSPLAPSPELRQRMQDSQAKANSGMSDPSASTSQNPAASNSSSSALDIPYSQTDEGREIDREYLEYERSEPWSVYQQNPEESNHLIQLDRLEAENHNSPELFIDAAREYLDECAATDPRFYQVIDIFEDYLIFSGADYSLTTTDHANYLRDLIISATFDW